MFERNKDSFSLSEQFKLHKSTVAIIGVGGGGQIVSEILTRSGIGNLILIDGDKFEESNKNRQLYSDNISLNKYKVDVAWNHLTDISTHIKIKYYNDYLNLDNYKEYLTDNIDIICDTIDGRNNKFIIADIAKKLDKPYVTGGCGNYRCWTAIINDHQYSTKDILKESGISLSPATTNVFLQGALQAQSIIDYILNRNQNIYNKVVRFNLQTLTSIVIDIKI